MTVLAELIKSADHIRFSHLSPATIEMLKKVILDTLGCAIGGFQSRAGEATREVSRSMAGSKSSRILGTEIGTACEYAALCNCAMIRAFDFNDVYCSVDVCHPSDNIGAALALADTVGASGRELLEAIAIGCEATIRLCDAVEFPGLYHKGWDHATLAAFSVPLMAGRLLGLDADAVVNALGIAISQNNCLGGIRRGELSMAKSLAFGLVAKGAISASLLAEGGVVGPGRILEGDKGFCQVVSGYQWDDVLVPWNGEGIERTIFKLFPVEIFIQGAVAGIQEIKNRYRVTPEDVLSVKVATFRFAYTATAGSAEKWTPKSPEAADHSMPYCIALAFFFEKVEKEHMQAEYFTSDNLLQFMQKIEVTHAPDLDFRYPDEMPLCFEVSLRDGNGITLEVDIPPGHPRNAPSMEQIEAKFVELAAPRFSDKRIGEIKKLVYEIDNLGSVDEVIRAMVFG